THAAQRATTLSEKATPTANFPIALQESDLLIEAASQTAVTQYVPPALDAGRDVILMSVGALADDTLKTRIDTAARATRRRVYIPSGAIAALDGIRAAHEAPLDHVHLTTAKPPAGFGAPANHITTRTTLYDGNAREAAKRYPKNVNVGAALALTGLGFDDTRVTVIADPTLTTNTHTIEARGAFGELRLQIHNRPFPENAATSYLAALAAIALLRKLAEPIWIGT
ncbi:MAG: aspartate dehydrogenase, partial [Thermoplasmatota archaeon]